VRRSSLVAPCTIPSSLPPTYQSELGRAVRALIALSFMVTDVLSFSLPLSVSSKLVYLALVWHVRAHDLGYFHSIIASENRVASQESVSMCIKQAHPQ
jgi:hypothetical protein